MVKCEFCGEEVALPFRCSFCNGYFCAEHRLAEQHFCLHAPKRIPLGDWKTKARHQLAKRKRRTKKILITATVLTILIIAVILLWLFFILLPSLR